MSKSQEIIASIIEFFSMVSCGIFIAFGFDVFKEMRKAVRKNHGKNFTVTVYVQDLLFLLFAFVVLVLTIYRINGGRVDWYISVGCISGAIIYYYIVEPIAGKVVFAVFFTVVKTVKIIFMTVLKVFSWISKRINAKKCKKTDNFSENLLKNSGET